MGLFNLRGPLLDTASAQQAARTVTTQPQCSCTGRCCNHIDLDAIRYKRAIDEQMNWYHTNLKRLEVALFVRNVAAHADINGFSSSAGTNIYGCLQPRLHSIQGPVQEERQTGRITG